MNNAIVQDAIIREATPADSDCLTELTFRSKAHWHYPAEYFVVWMDELTITPQYIMQNDVFVYEKDGAAAAYYSLVDIAEDFTVAGATITRGTWLEHCFVDPARLRNGIGTALFLHMAARMRGRGVDEVRILSDPHARGFYEKMGCVYKGEYPSTIIGRTTPCLEYRP